MPIKVLKARQIYDCTGTPTVEVEVRNDKDTAVASVAAGDSISNREALEVRDNEMRMWAGKGVLKAVENVNNYIAPLFVGKEIDETNQTMIDRMLIELDRTDDKSRLGANAIAGVSMAMARLGAMKDNTSWERQITRRFYPTCSDHAHDRFVGGGGLNFNTRLFLDEIAILPVGVKSFEDAMRAGSEIYFTLKQLLAKTYGLSATNIGPLGQFGPFIQNEIDALELVKKSIEAAGYTGYVKMGINCAAHTFFKNGTYDVNFKQIYGGRKGMLSSERMTELYRSFIIDYSAISLEDPFHFEDWDPWRNMTEKMSVQIVGSKLLATNLTLIKQAIEKMACNCLMIKINQIGTVSEAIECFKLSKDAGWSCIVGDRLGETEDAFMADFAVGISAGQIKAGAPCRYERLAKYNQLLRIEGKLGSNATFAGNNFRRIHQKL
ncbi:hypothetical protein HELRODRAFT_178270 [Helobdella robusta]|uniref:Enolase n=1 Tax=Helobdella robusta TaxID=6412 RepID=T1FD06_HELRO|nr:hypothetical protein HELRODRAFT_178270 [Helobdella robusta]ESN97161.1 hypothetical protein HELRODRAFT_178270 [Helobdella robusta]